MDDIVECTSDVYYPEEKAFILETRNPIWLSSIILKLIEEYPDILTRKKRSWFEAKNKQTGKLIKRECGLVLGDIYQTRNMYFPSCPKCQDRYPNTDEFWVLVEHESDPLKTKWFCCKTCAHRMWMRQEG